jgi:hypothetical protein
MAKPKKSYHDVWAFVASSPGGCLEWQRTTGTNGYGHFKVEGRGTVSAHRAAWIAVFGEVPDGLQVLHHCDNKVCVRPDHLYIGTPADNVQDAIDRGIRGRGNHKLTDKQIRAIRASKIGPKALGERYGVDRTSIWNIQTGKTWKNVI